MRRRNVLHTLAATWIAHRLNGRSVFASDDLAKRILQQAVDNGQVRGAVIHVRRGPPEGIEERSFAFGSAISTNAMFLLGSITKPLCMAAVMTLFDRGQFQLDDRVSRYVPGFTGEGRDQVTIRHLLTHVSGLPDQLPDNALLRRRHAPLGEFVKETLSTPLSFSPGTKYQYSSMGILLMSHLAERLSGESIARLVDQTILKPLDMKHSALGLGQFQPADFLPVQTEKAAPEAGGGDPAARDWDWNSRYWRGLGAPWGGGHASAPDLGKFLAEFLWAPGTALQPETARMMVRNHNPAGLTPRGLGFGVGESAGSPGCSDQTFGHTGSTGTLCWADPQSKTICVVLTTLPGGAVKPHPREAAAAEIARMP
jgi:CubicO group peptidase (beta-lactamase class C family)